jgi:hypothetical protein
MHICFSYSFDFSSLPSYVTISLERGVWASLFSPIANERQTSVCTMSQRLTDSGKSRELPFSADIRKTGLTEKGNFRLFAGNGSLFSLVGNR